MADYQVVRLKFHCCCKPFANILHIIDYQTITRALYIKMANLLHKNLHRTSYNMIAGTNLQLLHY